MINSVYEGSASGDERLDSELGRVCKLQENDYQYVLDGSFDLFNSVNQTLAHITRHSQQLTNNF